MSSVISYLTLYLILQMRPTFTNRNKTLRRSILDAGMNGYNYL